jgi:anti-anti-sigma factor
VRLTSHTVARRKPALIDLTEVTLIGSLGIGMLLAIAKALRNHGAGVAVLTGSGAARRVLELTQVSALIPVAETREDALRMLHLT